MKTRHLRILFVLGLGLILALLWLVKIPSMGLPISHAAGPWYVAPGGDDVDDCLSTATPCATINAAIAKASSGDTIYVAIGTYTGDDNSGDYEVVVLDKDITLSGGWEFGTLVLQSGISTIDGEGSYQGIVVNSSVTATVDHFAVQNGYTYGDGGGIHNSGTLTLTNSTVSNNTASYAGGGVHGSYGSWTFIINTQIYANTAIYQSGGGIGAENGGNLSLSRSWVVANAALNNDAGGIAVGSGGSAYVENSIIAGNISESWSDGGGGFLIGDGGPYRIVNSHIVGNRADAGAAIATYQPVQVELTNTIVISNTGNTGITDLWGSGSVFLLNYCDTYGNSPDGTSGVTISRTNCLGTPPEDGLDPLMLGGPLPGGVGPTFATQWMNYAYGLQVGSPAIDAGTSIGAPAIDIEGAPRDATPDMGAYELVPGVSLIPPNQTGLDEIGSTVTYTVRLVNHTGAADDFGLTVQPGNAWTTTLSLTQTGSLANGDILPLTVWVEIPPSASPGDVDSVTIQATSSTFPTVYSDTATIQTSAIGDLAYVTLSASDLVALVDTGGHTVVGTVDVGASGCEFPWRAMMSPDGAYVYVGCYNSNNVAVIETTGDTVVTTVGDIPGADGIAFTRDGAFALVGSRNNSQITVVDTSTYFATTISTPSNVRSIAAHPYLDTAYATSGDGNVLVIDTTIFSVTMSVPVGNDPWDIAVSPDGQWVFAGSRWGDGLAVIDANSNTVHTTVTGLGDLTGLDVAPDGSKVYASGLGNGVHVIDGVTFDHITTIGGMGTAWEAAVTCDGSELYVTTGRGDNKVPVIDTVTLTTTMQIAMPGSGAQGIAVCPQYVAAGVFISPPEQTNQGGRGQVIAHQGRLFNATGATDSFSLTLGSHVWDAALSVDSLGPIAHGDSVAFTVYVTVPVGVDWYLTDIVDVTATSVASPTVYSDTATFTTQAYAPPEISVSPDVLTNTQYVNDIVTKPLTISNGSGVTLTFNIVDTSVTDAVLLMHLDEPSGATTFHDDSGNDNHGSCLGASCPASGVSGKFGQALSFDGEDDYVQVPNGPGINPQQAIAISVWIYPDDWNGNRRIVQKGDDDQYRLLAEDGWLRFHLSGVDSLDTTLPETDVWHHVVGVYNGAEMQIWVDGQKEAEESVSGTIDATSDSLFIGTKHTSAPSGDHFNGLIDEVVIYDRALSAEEIETLYLSRPGSDDVSWLSKDPISGTVTTNSSTQVQVTFDATGLQPGTYTTQIVVQSNDPLTPSVSVPTTMTVRPTANMGWVEGTVTDVATGDPLEATIVAWGQPYTVTTDPGTGTYKLWLDEGNYTVRVAATGYVSETAAVNITAQQGITRNFGLVLNVPVLEVSHVSLQVTHDVGDVTMRAMTITNNGPAPLTFELRESDIGFSPTSGYASRLALNSTEIDQPLAFTTAYVTLSGSNLVALVNTETRTEIGTVNVGSAGCDFPWRATMSSDGDYVYVSCYNSDNIAVIETTGNTVATTVGGIYRADGIAFTRDGAYALVGSRHSNQIAIVDTATYSVTTYIYTPSNARSVAAHPYLDTAYATSADGNILVIDTTTFSVTASIPAGNDPWDVLVSPDGRWVFAGSRQGDGLAIIDADSNTVHTTVTGLGELTGLAMAPDGSAVYAAGIWNGIHVIDGMAFSHITTIPGLGRTWEAAVTCDGSALYVGNTGNDVPVIDTVTFSVTEQIPLSGSTARGIVICPQHVARDVSWLSEDPITGTVPGYSSTPVQVTFDATGVQPGDYMAEIIVRSNDPVTPSTSISVTMFVSPTGNMGRVTGAVSDAWTALPLEATVELVGVYSMTASPDYTIWATAGTYSLTAYASGYVSTTQPVAIIAGDVVTVNLALEPAQARLELETDAVSATAGEGGVVNQTLVISNTGPLPLDVALYEISPTLALRTMSPLSPADLTGKYILYDRAHGEPDSSEYSSLINDAISAGAVITENWYTIEAAVLEGYDVLWVNCCGYTGWSFGELNAVSDWLDQGGAIFVQGESSDATDGAASIFGINYESGSCDSGTTTNIADHPISEGVSAVNVEWTCWRLAPSVGADIVVYDTQGQPHVVAQEQNGGKVVVVASEDFTNGHIDNDDNRLLANNILAWLARPGYSDVPWLSETPLTATIPGHSSQPMTLEFDATSLSLGDYQATLAIEHNDPAQPSPVEVPVTLTVVTALPNQAPYMPTNPTPADGASNVPITQTLSWQGGDPDVGDTVTYTIAFGDSDPPPFVTTTVLTSYTPTLVTDTTYYWTITATDGISTTVGPTWHFTTVGIKYIYLPLVLRSH